MNWIDISELYGNTEEPEEDAGAEQKAPEKDEPETPEVETVVADMSQPDPDPLTGDPEEVATETDSSPHEDTDRLIGLSGADSASGGEPEGAHGGLSSRYGSKAAALQRTSADLPVSLTALLTASSSPAATRSNLGMPSGKGPDLI